MNKKTNAAEKLRLLENRDKNIPWKKWGPYLSERQWGTVREDYSPNGDAWNFFIHDQSRSRAYRWGEDDIAGISDDKQRLCFSLTLPARIVKMTFGLRDYFTDDVKRLFGSRKVPTSIDGMSPDNPILKTLADTPLATRVVGHSIIAVDGDGDPQLGDDGVVAYTSAHLDGMESEFIVRSGHSCQAHPFTIEEVRRILLQHLSTQAAPAH